MSAPIPSVFVSSTFYDLKQVRSNLRSFIDSMGFRSVLSEFDSFPVDPSLGTLENCKKAVEEHADLFVLIVGGRYGSETPTGKSITNIEYLQAKMKGIPINVFVSRSIQEALTIWRVNPSADFSAVADSPKLFEFVDSLYRGGDVWVHSFDYAEDIVSTLRKQWAYLIKGALDTRWKMRENALPEKLRGLPASALQLVVEQSAIWEFQFFSELFSWYVSASKDYRRDLDRGIVIGPVRSLEPREALDWINDKIRSHFKNNNALDALVNSEFKEALGPPGQPSDLEALDYVARRIGEVYRAEIENASELERVNLDHDLHRLVILLKESCLDLIRTIEEGQEKLKQELGRLSESLPTSFTFISLGGIGERSPYTELTAEYKRLAKKLNWSPKGS